MRVARVLLPALAACSFTGPPAGSGPIDARVAADTPFGADANNRTCVLGAGAPTIDRGKVGLSTGGNVVMPPLACDGDARIVGLALDMSKPRAAVDASSTCYF